MNESADAMLLVPEVYGLHTDAILTDMNSELIFGSFWAHDTAMREFQARLTLGHGDDTGITQFHAEGAHARLLAKVSISNLDQITGRVRTSIFGELIHCFVFHKQIVKPDYANSRAILICKQGDADNLWNVIKDICAVPLLDHWQNYLIPVMSEHAMIVHLKGINHNGTLIDIQEDDMAVIVKRGLLEGTLTVNN